VPVSLPNTTILDNYPPNPQVAGTDIFATGYFTVANNPVFAQYIYGQQGQDKFSPEFFLAPSVYPIFGNEANPIAGIRFRNAVAGSAAQVFGAFFYRNDPTLTPSSEFLSTISSAGLYTPPSTGAIRVIQRQSLSIAAANVTFTSIPGTFDSLFIIYQARLDAAIFNGSLNLRFNLDAGANYNLQLHGANNAANIAAANSLANQIQVGSITGAAATAGRAGSGDILIPNYAGTTFHKTLVAHNGFSQANTNGDQQYLDSTGTWISTAAVTSILLFPGAGNFIAGSTFTLLAYNTS